MIAKVAGVGARGAVGLSSLQMAMGIRSRLFEPRSLPWLDKRGREMGMALSGGLGIASHGVERFVALATPALSEAAALLLRAPGSGAQGVPLVVCLPEPGRPDDDPRMNGAILSTLMESTGIAVDLARSSVVREGQAGFAMALGKAKALLDGGAGSVLVGGVDSYYHRGVLEWLDRGHRLHALDAEDGIVPSEAAAFLLLQRGKGAGSGAVLYAESGREPNAADGGEPNLAGTTTGLLERAQAATGGPIRWAITDLNGERHRQREWQMASGRALATDYELTKWAWSLGDVGAASGPVYAAVALTMMRLGLAPAERAVIALHSEGVERGVVVLEEKASVRVAEVAS